jgi:zinc transporter ZupT
MLLYGGVFGQLYSSVRLVMEVLGWWCVTLAQPLFILISYMGFTNSYMIVFTVESIITSV